MLEVIIIWIIPPQVRGRVPRGDAPCARSPPALCQGPVREPLPLKRLFPGLPQVVSTPAWCGGCFVSESRSDKQVIPAWRVPWLIFPVVESYILLWRNNFQIGDMGFPVAQRYTIRLQCRRREFDPWVGKITWRRKWWPTPASLSEESHGQRSLAGYSPSCCTESHTTEAT